MPMFGDMMISSTAGLGERLHSVDEADAYIRTYVASTQRASDANDILYRFESSFDYDPSLEIGKITVPLLSILFADDQLNPVELRGNSARECPK